MASKILTSPKDGDVVFGALAWFTARPESRFLRIVSCLSPTFDFLRYARDYAELLRSEVCSYGALLVRGTDITRDGFAELCDVFGPACAHSELSSLRTELAPGVFTSTDHPADQKIQMHNEQAYLSYWPKYVSFFCEVAPTVGGQTPISDCRYFDGELTPSLRQRLRDRPVKYIRNFGLESTLSWRTAFQVNTFEELAAYCSRRSIELTIRPDGVVRTVSALPVFVRNPETGIECFFNNIVSASHHSLGPQQRAQIERLYPSEWDRPSGVCYGDGSSFSAEDIDELLGAYERRTFRFDWREGDVLILDNVATAHGREAFEGYRRIAVRISELLDTLGDAAQKVEWSES